MINPYEMIRTLSIVKQLSQGKTLTIDGFTIGMGKDMSIGCVMTNSDGQKYIMGLTTMDLRELNEALNRHNIGNMIPVE